MAGDWLKWTKGLARKPEVLHIAAQLGRSRHEVASVLMELWEWADDNAQIEEDEASAICPQNVRKTSATCPGIVRSPSASASLVDGLTGVSGFADAMSSVGWIAFRHGRIEFPNFSRHNGNPAKRRALDAERKQQGRGKARPQSVRKTSASEADEMRTREEKRREEKSLKTPLPPEAFEVFWRSYPRKEKKSKAIESWTKLAPDEALQQTILKALESHKRSDDWLREGGRYIPHATTWLNQRRWEDEIDPNRGKSDGHGNRVGSSNRIRPAEGKYDGIGTLYDLHAEAGGEGQPPPAA